MSDTILQVFVFRDGAYVGNEVFEGGDIMLGRAGQSHLILDDGSVAASQAVLRFDGQQATLLDLTSGDSTRVNHTPIRHSYVTPRDEIHIGPFTLKLKFVGTGASQSAPPAMGSSASSAAPSAATGEAAARSVFAARRARRASLSDFPAPSADDAPATDRGHPRAANAELTAQLTAQITAPITGSASSGQARIPTEIVRDRYSEQVSDHFAGSPTAIGSSDRGLSDPVGTLPTPVGGGLAAGASEDLTAVFEVDADDVVDTAASSQHFDPSLSPAATVPHRPPGPMVDQPPARQRQVGPPTVVQGLPMGNAPAFDPSGLESSSFEVMLDSAFLAEEVGSVDADAPSSASNPSPGIVDTTPGSLRPPPPPPDPGPVPVPSRRTMQGAPSSEPGTGGPAPMPDRIARPAEAKPAAPKADGQAAPRDAASARPGQKTPLARIPMGVPIAVEDDDLDEDERDANEPPGFSLLTQMTAVAPSDRPDLTAVEVVAFNGPSIESTQVLTLPGENYVLGRAKGSDHAPASGHRGLRLVTVTGPGMAEIEFPGSARGEIRKQGRTAQLDELKQPGHAVGRKDRYRVALKRGMYANLRLNGTVFHIRFVRPSSNVGTQPFLQKADPAFLPAVAGAFGAHIFLAILIALFAPSTSFSSIAAEAYAEVQEQAPRDVELKPEPPPPPPPEEPEPEVEPDPEPRVQPEPPPKRRPKKARRRRQRRPPPPAKGATREQVKTAGVLGAMGKLNVRAPGRRSMVSAVSNIDAVRAPGGSNFRVGALVGKTPTSEVQVGGGGGGKLLTRGSASLLKKGFGQLAGRRTGKVRGGVRRVSARRLKATGRISREAVARVINENLGEVQYCYERALLKKPGLKGKLVLEWRISTSGRVSKVRQTTSTLQSAEVSSCIIRKLKKWRFPKPSGGVVVVSYPFIFSSVGF